MRRLLLLLLLQAGFLPMLHGQAPQALFKIHPQPENQKPSSPLIFGNFIELGFARQIEMLWAEKLYNASFEEVPPISENVYGWLGKGRDADFSREKWWHNGYEVKDWYAWPKDPKVIIGKNRYWNFHHGLQAAVLENRQPSGEACLAQDMIRLDAGVKCLFRGYLSNNSTADSRKNPVTVKVGIYREGSLDKPLDVKEIIVPDGIFREYSVVLDPGMFSGLATFAVSVGQGKTLAADGFSLMPVNSLKGWRPEVVEALKKIHVPIIRYPGGCFASFYDWREGVGPRLDRQPVVSEYWGGIEENQAGTVEFVELCRMVDAEPFLCVNMLTGTADRAAQWVEYCNGGVETPMGMLRKQHGYPDPLGVKYWELDNETYRRFGWEEYARKCVEYAKAMKAVDPRIRLVMIGYWRFNDHLAEMLEIAGNYIDVITDRATGEKELGKDLNIIREYNRKNGTAITLCNTEWLAPLDFGNSGVDALNFPAALSKMSLQEHEISWNYAMKTARQLLLFQKLGGDFEFANFNNLANTWGQNIIECTRDTVFISAAGKVFELMSRSPVSQVLRTDTLAGLPGLFIQPGMTGNLTTAPDTLVVYSLNYRSDRPTLMLDLTSLKMGPVRVVTRAVHAADPLVYNSFGAPNEVKTSSGNFSLKKSGKVTIRIEPWSVTEINIIRPVGL